MTVKTVLLKLRRIVGWTIAAALGLVLAVIVLFFVLTRPFYNEITSDLEKDQVINLNKKLSADEVCIFDVGYSGLYEIQRRHPEYIRTSGSDMLHEPTSFWSVIAIHHKKKTFDQYLVRHGVVHLVEGANCSNSVMLRVERGRGESDFWFAFAQSGSPEGAGR